MKINYLFFSLLLVVGFSVSSCIKEEAPNAEADILGVRIENASELLTVEPSIEDRRIIFTLKENVENLEFAPVFKLSQGATIEPKNGTPFSFVNNVLYKVTSENGVYNKTYEVIFIPVSFPNYYSFEDIETVITEGPVGMYNEFIDFDDKGNKIFNWATGNFGYNILAETLKPKDEELNPTHYPTYSTEDGYIGKGVTMVTKSTGFLGGMMGAPLAAGNLYLGKFVFSFPAIESTRFGIPYSSEEKPTKVTGHFKYKRGPGKFIKNETTTRTHDDWDAYAILFEKVAGENNYIQGDHSFKDPRMVMVAKLDEKYRIESDQYIPFELNFETLEGKSFDPNKEYMFTIVISSSVEGDVFNGTIGSMLSVDEIEIITEE